METGVEEAAGVQAVRAAEPRAAEAVEVQAVPAADTAAAQGQVIVPVPRTAVIEATSGNRLRITGLSLSSE